MAFLYPDLMIASPSGNQLPISIMEDHVKKGKPLDDDSVVHKFIYARKVFNDGLALSLLEGRHIEAAEQMCKALAIESRACDRCIEQDYNDITKCLLVLRFSAKTDSILFITFFMNMHTLCSISAHFLLRIFHVYY
eukprot:TRINITY_DN7996_c0_g1_i1.p1 TRINITY_DN7996_c0_g1~~TRINITY_DN7996_c0_g1_i1.p1  ORF type:complete len:136 (+),score=12.27 TRINITY_DN7996_c0_g1_i1:250-657(+)